jgi:hypothetical protein
MGVKTSGSPAWWRVLVLACIAVAGLVTIVGSGGGGDAPQCSFFSNVCNPTVGPSPPPLYATIGPRRVAVQVGGTVVFVVESNVDQPAYQWCRLPAGASVCTEIAGATDATYRLAGANLSDDGATFRVTVTGTNGTTWAVSSVAVSSMPGVMFQDGEFLDADWAVTTIAMPSQDGPTASVARAATGGNPGAFRVSTYQLPSVQSSVRVFYSAVSAGYDPAVQGAINVIDFAEDCINSSSSNLMSYTVPMFEQAGRRFIASRSEVFCAARSWTAARRSSLGAEDFELVDGPACAAGESCPDFSGGGAPIRLGLVGGADNRSGGVVLPVQTSHGFDNWKVTVWRR